MCPHQISTAVEDSTSWLSPCSGSSSVAMPAWKPASRRAPAMVSWIPPGYIEATWGLIFSWRCSFQTITRSGAVILLIFLLGFFVIGNDSRSTLLVFPLKGQHSTHYKVMPSDLACGHNDSVKTDNHQRLSRIPAGPSAGCGAPTGGLLPGRGGIPESL